MRSLDLHDLDPAVRLAGILDAAPTATGGLALSRLPRAAIDQIIDPVLLWIASAPSGARLEFTSTTTAIEVDVQLTGLAYGDDSPPPAVFDLVIDGSLVASRTASDGHAVRIRDRTNPASIGFDIGGPATIRFDDLPLDAKAIEIWLPANASVELLAVRIDDDADLTATAPAPRRWVHYGSSISHCMEAARPTGVWPVIAARAAGVDLQSLAIAGQAQLDQFAARTIRDLDVDLISAKIGINLVNADSMRERTFVPAVHGFLDTIRDGHPTTPIIVLTPITCPVVEDAPGPTATDAFGTCVRVDRPTALAEGSLTLTSIRRLLGLVVEQRQAAGDAHLHLIEGTELFGPDDVGDLPDGLHPNAAGYARMGDRFHALAFGPGGPFGS